MENKKNSPMWKGLQEMLLWLNGEEDSSSPEEASMASVVKLAAISAVATILQNRIRESHDSDEDTPQPGAAG